MINRTSKRCSLQMSYHACILFLFNFALPLIHHLSLVLSAMLLEMTVGEIKHEIGNLMWARELSFS